MASSQLTPAQVRAAQALLDWDNFTLAKASGVAVKTIVNVKTGDSSNPHKRVAEAIRAAFERQGVEFTPGGVRIVDDVVKVLEGANAYLQVLEDVLSTVAGQGGEVLFLFSDDRDARAGEVELEERIRAHGVKFRVLIEEGNSVIRWPREEYRQIPSTYFNHDLQVIYGGKVAQLIAGGKKIIIINNPSFATTARNLFNVVWPIMREVI